MRGHEDGCLRLRGRIIAKQCKRLFRFPVEPVLSGARSHARVGTTAGGDAMRTLLVLMLSLLVTAAHAQVGVPVTPGEPAKKPAVMDQVGSSVGVPVSPEAVPTPAIPLTPSPAQGSGSSSVPSSSSPLLSVPKTGGPSTPSAPSALPQMNDPPRPDLYRPDLR